MIEFDRLEIERRLDPEREFRENINFVLLLAAIVLLFTQIFPVYVYNRLHVQGSSMLPTFADEGDSVFVCKLGGYAYGDVVVVYADKAKYTLISTTGYIIKRVIAMPGDTVSLEWDEERNECFLRIENERGIFILEDEPYLYEPMERSYFDKYGGEVYTVGENQLFVLGDNRAVSNDSFRLGCFDRDEVLGRVVLKVTDGGFFGLTRDFKTDYEYVY